MWLTSYSGQTHTDEICRAAESMMQQMKIIEDSPAPSLQWT